MAKIPLKADQESDSPAPQPHDPWLRALEEARRARVARVVARGWAECVSWSEFAAFVNRAADLQSRRSAAKARRALPEWYWWAVVLASAMLGALVGGAAATALSAL